MELGLSTDQLTEKGVWSSQGNTGSILMAHRVRLLSRHTTVEPGSRQVNSMMENGLLLFLVALVTEKPEIYAAAEGH